MRVPQLPISSESYRWWVLGVTVIGGFMSILDSSIVNIALPKMMAVFAVDTDKAEWILTAYMLTMGIVQPVTGYFCDRFGTRTMYLFSLAVFVLGSALCGMAWSNDSMILFRVIQAMGGGLIIPVTMSMVFQVFPLEQRNMAMGLWGISAMVAPAVGPALSGYLVDYMDWRLIFTINIPVGIMGYVLAAMVLRETPLRKDGYFDYKGCLASAVGLFCLLLALSKGTTEGWTSVYIVTLFYVSFVGLTMFVAIELTEEHPMLDLRLLADWNFSVSNAVVFIGTVALYGGIFLVPLFLENLLGYTAMQTGVLMFPSAVCSGLMMPVAAKLADRFGAKPVILVGLVILTAGSFACVAIDLGASSHYIMLVMMVRGLGIGLFMMPMSVLGMANVPANRISQASSMSNAVRQISGSLGIAVLGTVLQERNNFHVAHIAESVNTLSLSANKMILYATQLFMHNGSVATVAQRQALALVSMLTQQQAYVFAFDDAFFTVTMVCVIGFLMALLTKSAPKPSGGEKVFVME